MLISAIAASMKPKPKKLLTVKKEKKSTAPTPASLKRMKENALAQTRAQEATEGVGCFGFPDVCVFLFFPKCVCVSATCTRVPCLCLVFCFSGRSWTSVRMIYKYVIYSYIYILTDTHTQVGDGFPLLFHVY